MLQIAATTGAFQIGGANTYPDSWFPPAWGSVPRSTTAAAHSPRTTASTAPTPDPAPPEPASAGATGADALNDPALADLLYPSMPRWKRTLDLAGSLLAILALSPVLLVTAAFIKLVSPGPMLFRQQRVGYRRLPFTLYKFRTMTVGADTSRHTAYVRKLIVEDSESRSMTKLDLPHVIRGGRLIRALCIDELPQLFNVLAGDMSIVGPRPCLPYEADEYLRWHARRFNSVPGMTGLWQVSGKNRTTFKEMIRLDIQYEQRRALTLDLKIMLATPVAILHQVIERLLPSARRASPEALAATPPPATAGDERSGSGGVPG